MEIRPARKEDIEEILPILEIARDFMHSHGNLVQWSGVYPARADLEMHIGLEELYVGVGEEGHVHMTFAFCVGDDPCYARIEDGDWLNDEPYGTIHLVASDRTRKGCFGECLSFCKAEAMRRGFRNIRIDTHADNAVMNALCGKYHFIRCGIIYIADGTPRTAYQLVLKDL